MCRRQPTYGATRSAPFRALVRTPRVLRPVRQVLGTDDVYVYHTKINAKPAIEGTIWMWHQDYNAWSKDGCPTPNMATFNVMLNEGRATPAQIRGWVANRFY